MSLQSKLLRGDPKLEAAAKVDSAHVLPGASGVHAYKIQVALTLLDDAAIAGDELQRQTIGSTTAAAVLAYKRKRDIVNRAYQSQADNIVGRLTMASLDTELLRWQTLQHPPVTIQPLSFARIFPPRSPALLVFLGQAQAPTGRSATVSAFGITDPPEPQPKILPGPNAVLELLQNGAGSFLISDGQFGEVTIADPSLAKIFPASDGILHTGDGKSCRVLDDLAEFKVFSGRLLGRTTITVRNMLGASASLDLVVKKFPAPPVFHPGVNHAHTASLRWPEVQANPNSPGVIGAVLSGMAKFMSPLQLVNAAISLRFNDKPIALRHLNWYLRDGGGKDFIEDDNIKAWVAADSGIRGRLKREIFVGGSRKPKMEGHFFFAQSDFANEDFQFAFGAVDRVDFEVDLRDDTVRVWFQDRYEWHPSYPSLYSALPGDGVRDTNCLHAALVELKSSGATDFWMKGEAVVPLSLVIRS